MAVFLAGSVAACDGPSTVAPDAAPVLSVLATVEGGSAEAFALTDAVSVVVLASAGVVHDETVAFSPGGGATLRVQLPPHLAGTQIQVTATLLAGGQGVFRGTASVQLDATAPTQVTLSLTPIVAAIQLEDPVATFDAIGASGVLGAVPVFATGHAVPGVALTWSSLSPGIVDVAPDGSASAVAEGEGQVRVSVGSVTATGRVVVRAQVASVEVQPASAVVRVGQSQAFQAVARDRNRNLLQRTPQWRALDGAVASVSSAGVAVGVGRGQTGIEATVEGVSGSASLTVVAVPEAPSNLVGVIVDQLTRAYELTWVDNSDDETQFQVESSVAGGPWGAIATLGANSTSFEGTGAVGTNDFRVLACNQHGCSPPSNEVRLFFLGPPTVAPILEGRIVDPRALAYELEWEDNVPNETGFVVEHRVGEGGWTQVGSVPANTTSFSGTAVSGDNYFRVRACNQYGCGPASNEVHLFFEAPPTVVTLPSPGVVVLRGHVTASGEYSAKFRFWREQSESSGGYEETDWVSASGSAFWEMVLPFAYAGEVIEYQIFARNDLGESAGEILSTTVPHLRVQTDPTFFTYYEPDVTAILTIVTPGTENPVESVEFYYIFSNVSAVDDNPVFEDGGSAWRFTYSVTLPVAEDIRDWEWVAAAARYRTGSTVYAYTACVEEGYNGESSGYCTDGPGDATAIPGVPRPQAAPPVQPRALPGGGR